MIGGSGVRCGEVGNLNPGILQVAEQQVLPRGARGVGIDIDPERIADGLVLMDRDHLAGCDVPQADDHVVAACCEEAVIGASCALAPAGSRPRRWSGCASRSRSMYISDSRSALKEALKKFPTAMLVEAGMLIAVEDSEVATFEEWGIG